MQLSFIDFGTLYSCGIKGHFLLGRGKGLKIKEVFYLKLGKLP
ncbi:hypothetical protein B4146_2057 [Bacillus subtilis]|uniref:Uncharacterized protein n=1 Tax=Bacillus subtilis TaxID=1423 RepID=A0AAP1EF74_BACIU|nr:hypothetical protein B4146_2057 [Bacillus subtilis]KZD95253.1 hypothetical protein B4122_0225 [Bacillus subtilis]